MEALGGGILLDCLTETVGDTFPGVLGGGFFFCGFCFLESSGDILPGVDLSHCRTGGFRDRFSGFGDGVLLDFLFAAFDVLHGDTGR